MKNLGEILESAEGISQGDFINYCYQVLNDDEYLAFVLGSIIHENELYSKQIREMKYKGDTLNAHIVNRSLKILNYLGLIKIKISVGVTVIYTSTKIGTKVMEKWANNKRKRERE